MPRSLRPFAVDVIEAYGFQFSPYNTKQCNDKGEHTGSTLHRVVQWFKTMTTNAYINGIKQHGWQPFNTRFWQRNYYEHIIRNQQAYDEIEAYIIENPLNWETDDLYTEQ